MLNLSSNDYLNLSTNADLKLEFIEKYKKINKKDPNLLKQIEGLKIAKPIIIAGLVYYIAIPLISTFMADRIKQR